MREQPKGEELLSCAREYLKESILPIVSAEQKHGILMVMNAIAIARRQLAKGAQPEIEELEALRTLVDDPGVNLLQGNRLLAGFIRDGAGDPGRPGRAVLLEHLRMVTRWRVLESNPRALSSTAR